MYRTNILFSQKKIRDFKLFFSFHTIIFWNVIVEIDNLIKHIYKSSIYSKCLHYFTSDDYINTLFVLTINVV